MNGVLSWICLERCATRSTVTLQRAVSYLARTKIRRPRRTRHRLRMCHHRTTRHRRTIHRKRLRTVILGYSARQALDLWFRFITLPHGTYYASIARFTMSTWSSRSLDTSCSYLPKATVTPCPEHSSSRWPCPRMFLPKSKTSSLSCTGPTSSLWALLSSEESSGVTCEMDTRSRTPCLGHHRKVSSL